MATPEVPGPAAGSRVTGAGSTDHPLLGYALMDELREVLDAVEITGYLADYVALTGWDARSQQLFHAVGDGADLTEPEHRDAVVHWLRAWGCRHLRRADSAGTGEVILGWWEAWERELPTADRDLTELTDAELAAVAPAYEALRSSLAPGRHLGARAVDVLLGDTAAAKTLFAVRPGIFIPWDDPIRLAFGWWGGGPAYAEFLALSAATLRDVAGRLDGSVDGLPGMFGRPQSTPPKLVDEYLWVRVTKAL